MLRLSRNVCRSTRPLAKLRSITICAVRRAVDVARRRVHGLVVDDLRLRRHDRRRRRPAGMPGGSMRTTGCTLAAVSPDSRSRTNATVAARAGLMSWAARKMKNPTTPPPMQHSTIRPAEHDQHDLQCRVAELARSRGGRRRCSRRRQSRAGNSWGRHPRAWDALRLHARRHPRWRVRRTRTGRRRVSRIRRAGRLVAGARFAGTRVARFGRTWCIGARCIAAWFGCRGVVHRDLVDRDPVPPDQTPAVAILRPGSALPVAAPHRGAATPTDPRIGRERIGELRSGGTSPGRARNSAGPSRLATLAANHPRRSGHGGAYPLNEPPTSRTALANRAARTVE